MPSGCAPAHIKGVVKLRGSIVPIVDLRLRLRFQLGMRESAGDGVIVILNIADRVIGMVVDSVADVIGIRPGEIGQAPRLIERLAA